MPSIKSNNFNYLTRVITTAGNVTMTAQDSLLILNKTSSQITTVTLPASPVAGQRVIIKDGKGDCDLYNITVQAASGNIDGQATWIMHLIYSSMDLVYNGTQWNIL